MEITPHTLLEYYQVAFDNLTYQVAITMRQRCVPMIGDARLAARYTIAMADKYS